MNSSPSIPNPFISVAPSSPIIIIIIINLLNCYVQNSKLRSNLVIDVGDKKKFGYQHICSQIHQIHTRIFINFIGFFIWN
jgi:hypothetical protein